MIPASFLMGIAETGTISKPIFVACMAFLAFGGGSSWAGGWTGWGRSYLFQTLGLSWVRFM